MTGLVKEITEADVSRRLTDEIQSQGGGGSAEDTDDRIEFLAAVLEVCAGDSEIGEVGRGCGDK